MGRLEIPVVRIFCLIKILLTLPVISMVRVFILPLFWLSQVLFIQPWSEYWQCSRVFCLVLPPHRSVLIPKRIGCQQDRKLELDWFFEITRSNDKLKLWYDDMEAFHDINDRIQEWFGGDRNKKLLTKTSYWIRMRWQPLRLVGGRGGTNSCSDFQSSVEPAFILPRLIAASSLLSVSMTLFLVMYWIV